MWPCIIALIAGGFLPFAFSPIFLFTLAFFMPAVLFYLWLRSTPLKAFLLGLCFGLGMFGVGSSWVYISIHNFGNATGLLAAALTLLGIFIMALFPAIQGYFVRKFWSQKSDLINCLCVFPATWVIFEYARSFIFPFLFLGYSQTNNPMAGLAPIFGVYGLSLAVAIIAGALVVLARKNTNQHKLIALVISICIIVISWAYHSHAWTKPYDKPIKISMIQGNISQKIKWNPGDVDHILDVYQQLTQSHWSSRVIIWPEAAIPFDPREDAKYVNTLSQTAKQHHTTIVVGAPLSTGVADNYFNGLILLGTDHGYYLKRHLVPFGEYIPFTRIFGGLMKSLNIPMSSLIPGPKYQPPLMIAGIPVAAFICYETAFPIESLDSIQGKAMAIDIVDDAWFGHSFAAAQQLQMTQMRALETGRYIAVTANTGITALINPFGQLINALPIDQENVLTIMAHAMQGKTPLMKSNYCPVLILLIILLIISLANKKALRD